MQSLVIEMSKQELYEKLWTVPITVIAKEYGIPYAQLMKQIKESGIPAPPSGYWTKLSFGKHVEKTPFVAPPDAMVALYRSFDTIKTIERVVAPAIPKPKPKSNKSRQLMTKVLVTQQSADVDGAENRAEAVDPVETFKQYGQTYNIYDRDRLYREVWEKPIVEIAKQYGVSDVMIHKVCKSLNIPAPKRGYWAKLRAGKPVKQTPLVNAGAKETTVGVRTYSEPKIQVEKELLSFLSDEDKSLVFSIAMQIQLPEENARMHPKIVAHRKRIVEWHKNASSQTPFLADTISDSSLPRVCRIYDALIKALEPLGCSLTDDLKFVINDETIQIAVSESRDKIDHVLTKEENFQLLKYQEDKRRYSWASQPNIRKYDHVYNGKITLAVGTEKSFRDCKSYVIEDRLGDILILLYESSNTIKCQRLVREEEERRRREAREAEERRRQEEERLREERRVKRNIEIKRTNALVSAAVDFDTAQKIRAYINALEQKTSLTQDEMAWIEWAKKKADWYDPTVKRGDEFLGTRVHGQELVEEAKKRPWEL